MIPPFNTASTIEPTLPHDLAESTRKSHCTRAMKACYDLHMQNITPWQRFLARTTKGTEQSAVAKRTGVSPATVSRWFSRPSGSAEHVILIARAFGDDPTLALVDTGFLTMQEATRGALTTDDLLSRLDEIDLAREIVRRLEAGEAGDALADEVPADVSGMTDDELSQLDPTKFDLAATRDASTVEEQAAPNYEDESQDSPEA